MALHYFRKGKHKVKVNKSLLHDTFIFAILLIFGMWLSAFLQHESNWDFSNYHYYNAFAFLNNRLNYDIVPAAVNGFFNPIIELPLWFYVQYFNDNTNLIYALQGIWGGLMLFVFYKIYRLFFKLEGTLSYIVLCLSLLLTLSGEGVFWQYGSSSNEIPIAFLLLWGLYILLKMIKLPETQTLKKFFAAGLIMGIALGLKQTAVSYCVAAGLMLIIGYKHLNKPYKSILLFALGGFIAYIVLNGWFMYKYWVLYGNPFFPFLNGVFHSPYFDDFNYRDTRYLPPLKHFFIYPILWNFPGYTIRELPFFDLRLMLVYLSIIGIFIWLAYKKKLKVFFETKPLDASLYLFITFSFLIWMAMFSILRYATVVEIIAIIWLAKTLHWLLAQKSLILPAICISLLITLLSTSVFEDGVPHKRTREKFISMEEIKLPENTLLKLYGFPTSVVIPEFSKNAQFRAMGYKPYNRKYQKGSDFVDRGVFRNMRDEIEKSHKGPVVIVYLNYSLSPHADVTVMHQKRLKCEQKKQKGEFPKDFDCSLGFCETWDDFEDALAAELGDKYFCRPLKNNMDNRLNICAPKELKSQILGEENDR